MDAEESLISPSSAPSCSADNFTYEFPEVASGKKGMQKGLPRAVMEINRAGNNDSHSLRQSSWMHSAAIIVGEIMGWVMGLGSVVVFGFCSNYSALLLANIRNRHYPHAHSYSDLAREIVGPNFSRITRTAILINWASILPYYLMAASSSLVSAFAGWRLCYWQWAGVLMICTIFPLQYRTLHSLAYLSAISDAVVIVCLAIILWVLTADENREPAVTSLWPPPDITFIDGYGCLSSFIFAFQGHSMFLEIMREMQDSRQFPRSAAYANGMMGVVYLLTTGVAYHSVGSKVEGFLPFSLPDGPLKTIIGVLLCFHIIVSYLLCNQPLCAYLQENGHFLFLLRWVRWLQWLPCVCCDERRSRGPHTHARIGVSDKQADDEACEAEDFGGVGVGQAISMSTMDAVIPAASAPAHGSHGSYGMAHGRGGSPRPEDDQHGDAPIGAPCSPPGHGHGTTHASASAHGKKWSSRGGAGAEGIHVRMLEDRDDHKRLHWFLLTAFFLVFAYLVANAIPFFSDFQNIIGSLLGAPIVFGWPPFFYLQSVKRHGEPLRLFDRLLCYVFLFVLLPLCMVLGFISALGSLRENWNTYGRPFDCYLVGY